MHSIFQDLPALVKNHGAALDGHNRGIGRYANLNRLSTATETRQRTATTRGLSRSGIPRLPARYGQATSPCTHLPHPVGFPHRPNHILWKTNPHVLACHAKRKEARDNDSGSNPNRNDCWVRGSAWHGGHSLIRRGRTHHAPSRRRPSKPNPTESVSAD